MHEFGHAEGRDYIADWRFANGRYGRFSDFAQDFVRLKVDVVFLETAAASLVELGHEPARIKTERFGPTGET